MIRPTLYHIEKPRCYKCGGELIEISAVHFVCSYCTENWKEITKTVKKQLDTK